MPTLQSVALLTLLARMVGVVVELLDVTGVPFRSVIAGQDEAGGDKRILGANKLSPAGAHYESVTLVYHDSRMPVVSRGYYEESGEQAALRPLDGRDPNHYPRDVTLREDSQPHSHG